MAACLEKDAASRPPVKALLKHKFIRSAKKSSLLTELIVRYQRYKEVVPDSEEDDDNKSDMEDSVLAQKGSEAAGSDDDDKEHSDEGAWDYTATMVR